MSVSATNQILMENVWLKLEIKMLHKNLPCLLHVTLYRSDPDLCRARQGQQATKSRPDPRNAVKTTVTKTVPVKTVPVTKTVPVKTVTVPSRTGQPKARKAISTPTKEDVTLSDLTLDASCISSRAGSSQALDSTMVAPGPMQRPLVAGGGARASVRGRPSSGARMKLPLQPVSR